MAAELNSCNRVIRQRTEVPNVFQFAADKRDNEIFNNVTIKVENSYFPANRMILSCCSEVFEKLFLTEMKEKYENEVEVKDVDSNSMKKVINFMYTGRVSIDDETDAINLLSAAEYLQLNELKRFCSEYLESVITSGNCFVILKVADIYRCEKLKKKTNQIISSNLNQLALTLDFKYLSKHDLTSYFSEMDCNITSEITKYQAIIIWIKHDEGCRLSEVQHLLQFIDFSKFPLDYLIDVVLNEAMVTESKQSLPMLIKSLTYVNKKRKLKQSGSQILSLGWQKSGTNFLEIFNISEEASKQFPDLPVPTQTPSAVKIGEVVFCVDVTDVTDDIISESVIHVWKMKLNETNRKWEKAAPMNVERLLFSTTHFQNHLVVAGGCNNKHELNSTEVYLDEFDEWRSLSPLQTARFSHCLVECNGSLFAIGGSDNNVQSLCSVELLSGLKSKWTYVKPMQTARQWFTAVSLNGHVFAIAGCSDSGNTLLKSVEKYDMVADEWIHVSDLNIKRYWHAACVFQNKIYVVGGLDSDDMCVKEIECYDPDTNTWTIVDRTTHDLYNHSLLVV